MNSNDKITMTIVPVVKPVTERFVVLFVGNEDWEDEDMAEEAFTDITKSAVSEGKSIVLAHGGSQRSDKIAVHIAKKRGWSTLRFVFNHFIDVSTRNLRMIEMHQPHAALICITPATNDDEANDWCRQLHEYEQSDSSRLQCVKVIHEF